MLRESYSSDSDSSDSEIIAVSLPTVKRHVPDKKDIKEVRSKMSEMLSLAIQNPHNVKAIEKTIFNTTIRYSNKHLLKHDSFKFEDIYNEIGYNLYGKITDTNLKELRKELIENILMWNSSVYNDLKLEEDLTYALIENPEHLKVEEGMYKCRKCGSKRIHHYSMQTRGGDESTTVFFTCVKCGKKWVT